MATKARPKTGFRRLAIWVPTIMAALLPIGCGEDAQSSKAVPVSSVQGASFDVSSAPSKVEPVRTLDVVTPTQPNPTPAETQTEIPPAVTVKAPAEAELAPRESTAQVPAPPVPGTVPKPRVSESPVVTKEGSAAAEKPAVVNSDPKVVEKPVETKADPRKDDLLELPFGKLAFRYWPQAKGGRDPIPAEIRKLDGRKIAIEGYMMPIDFEKGKVRSFLLSRSMMGCCYADSPGITDVIKVQRADGKTLSFEQMVRVTGTLEVGEEKDADGYLESVYRIKADLLSPVIFGK